uniref:Reverse transcriptase Ty1/copia-type domain-containing protein n=1 Tax=Solanum lycopersicum TaxID=4081 RepID=A0A3Q7IG25_SOLLC
MSDYIYQVKDELPQSLAAINLQNITDDTLYVDSGASSQMAHRYPNSLKHYNEPDKIIVGNGLNKLAKDNCCTLEFDETNFVVKVKWTRTLLNKGFKRNGLNALEDNNLYSLTDAHDYNMLNNMCHTTLGHPNLNYLKFLSRSNPSHVLELVLQLGNKFSMKDLGPLIFFLGIEVNYFEGGIHFNQSKYGVEMLAKTGMTLTKALATPLARKHGLHEAVGSFVYASF